MTVRSEVQAATGPALNWRHLTGAAGIAGVVLSVITGVVVGDYPDIDKPAAELRDWFEDNGTTVQTVNYVHAIGLLFLLAPFLLGMRSLLARAEGAEALWTHLGFFGGVLFIALNLVAVGYTGVLAVTVDDLDDGVLVALKHAEYITLALAYGLASGLYLLGSGVVIVRTGALWRWLGWIGIPFGGIAVIGTAGVIDPDPESLLAAVNFLGGAIGFGIVILLQGVGMLTKRSEDHEAKLT